MNETSAPAGEAPMTADEGGAVPAGAVEAPSSPHPALVEAELLVEEVSIDGMCGVY